MPEEATRLIDVHSTKIIPKIEDEKVDLVDFEMKEGEMDDPVTKAVSPAPAEDEKLLA